MNPPHLLTCSGFNRHCSMISMVPQYHIFNYDTPPMFEVYLSRALNWLGVAVNKHWKKNMWQKCSRYKTTKMLFYSLWVNKITSLNVLETRSWTTHWYIHGHCWNKVLFTVTDLLVMVIILTEQIFQFQMLHASECYSQMLSSNNNAIQKQ